MSKKIVLGTCVVLSGLPAILAFYWMFLLSPGAFKGLLNGQTNLIEWLVTFMVLIFPLLAFAGFIVSFRGFKNKDVKTAILGMLVAYSYFLFRLVYFSVV